MEFEDAWLEVKACEGGSATDASGAMLEVPAISEALEAAANASKRPGIWDYSRRLGADEIEVVRGTVQLAKTAEDGRSVSYSVNIAYKASQYTLTLFAVKRSQ